MIPTVVLVYHAGDRLGPEPVKFPNHLVPSFKLTCRNSQFVVPVRHAELDIEYSEYNALKALYYNALKGLQASTANQSSDHHPSLA